MNERLVLAATALISGDLVAIPTETVYGLAGDAFNPSALAKIFATKERPTFDPLIIHVSQEVAADPHGILQTLRMLKLINPDLLTPLARQRGEFLLRKFWPGPFTLVLPKAKEVPDLATSGLPTVALRMPSHPIAQEILKLCKTPLAAPSANRFGRISPTTAAHVKEELGDRVKLIIDGGACSVGVESTVAQLHPNGDVSLLRPGAITREQIEAVIGAALVAASPTTLASPGMLESHYAPQKLFFSLKNSWNQITPEETQSIRSHATKSIGYLAIFGDEKKISLTLQDKLGVPITVKVLSAKGSWPEAAQNLFAALRELDQSSAEMLLTEPCSETTGLAHAIQDRLNRASKPLLATL